VSSNGVKLSLLPRVWGVVAIFATAGCAYGGSEQGSGGDDSGVDSAAADAGATDGASDVHAVGPDAAHDSGEAVESGASEAGDDASSGTDGSVDDGTSSDATEEGAGLDATDGPSTADSSDASGTDASDATVADAHDASATDASDGSPPMDAADTTPPSVPTGLNQTGSTVTTITLGWTASTDPDSPVAGYRVYRNGVQVGTPTSPSFTDSGLTVMTSYSYTISAYDPTGNVSAQSAALMASTAADTTAPSVPTGLAKTGATTTTISLGWTASTDPDSPVAGYKVYRNATQVGTSTSTSYTDTGLTVMTSYAYTVSAYDPAGNNSAQSASLIASTAPDTTPPSVPVGLTKTGATTTTISLSWTASTDPDSPVTGYHVYRNGTQVGTPTAASFTDTGLTDATQYSYTVSAYDPAGNNSAQSAALLVSTATCAINVTTNTYGTTAYDGYVTYKNSGTGAEMTPVLSFDLPAGATLDMAQCYLANFTVPGTITAVTCAQTGTTVRMNFTGSLASAASIAIYYSTQNSTEAIAANVTVKAASCP
jgi:chitodextrinase